MKRLFAVALIAVSLNAQEAVEVNSLLHTPSVEKVEQAAEYTKIVLDMEESSSPLLADEETSEITAILEENNRGLEMKSSLDGYVEKETAAILQEVALSDEGSEELSSDLGPELVDLAELASKPAVTLSVAPSEELSGYDDLPISGEEKQKIAKILTTMAENNLFGLLYERKFLERLGDEIHHVHPLRFLGTVFEDPRLIRCMHIIRRSSFKWNGFIDGIGERLKEEIKAGNVNSYLPGLADRLGVRVKDLQSYTNRSDVEGMVIFLLEKNR